MVPPRPNLPEVLEIYLNAFFDLTADRNTEMGCISFLALDRYATRFGIDGDQFVRFKELIRRLDNEYLSIQGRKMAQLAQRRN